MIFATLQIISPLNNFNYLKYCLCNIPLFQNWRQKFTTVKVLSNTTLFLLLNFFNLVAYEFQSDISVIVVFLGSHNAVNAVLESVKRQWNSSGNSIVWIAPDFWFLLERVILPGLTMGFNYIPLLHVHIYSLYMALHLSWQILCGFVRRDFTKTKPWPTTSWLNCQIQNLIVDVF